MLTFSTVTYHFVDKESGKDLVDSYSIKNTRKPQLQRPRIGFTNKEIIIKEQHNCRSTEFWEKQNNKFLLLAHEYIFVFQK